METISESYQLAFTAWLRTGSWPIAERRDDIELKFNPYHDPRNGQFTFAPGGPRSLSRVIVSERRQHALPSSRLASAKDGSPSGKLMLGDAAGRAATFQDAVYRPSEHNGSIIPASRIPRTSSGNNASAFHDPMTLQQAVPNIQSRPGGAIIALAGNLIDYNGPGQELTAQMAREWSNLLINQIRAIDPNYRFESLGFPQTLEGQINQLDKLRFDRAAAFIRVKGEVRPLQVETLRFMQNATDLAYTQGLEQLRAGRLDIRLSEQEALGNFIDREVRVKLRRIYDQYGMDSVAKGLVRVNRRENITLGSETSFRRPDARVGNIAYDVTLARKTLKTPQIKGFFNADFKPSHVVIIRPRQIEPVSSYIITRPETK